MKEHWNKRYASKEYAYGEEPNQFFKDQLLNSARGKLLMPAEGEGRNAVYAARQGWEVAAFDQSEVGKAKAELLAEKHNITIDYQVNGIEDIGFTENSFDAMGLVFAHFPPNLRTKYHNILAKYVKKGGVIILEGFSKKHLANQAKNPTAGGPPSIDMLFSIDEIKNDFEGFDPILLEEREATLQEGVYHDGKAYVINFVGRKR